MKCLERKISHCILPFTQLFFQHDSELNTPMITATIFFRKDDDQSIQYSGSTNLTSHGSLTLLI